MTRRPSPRTQPTGQDGLDPETVRELLGTPPPDTQDAAFDTTEVETRATGVTDQELYEGESGPIDEFGAIVSAGQLERLEDTALRSDETDDPYLASDEGLPYVPPSDPVVAPSDGPEGLEVAAGLGVGATDEPHGERGGSTLLAAEDDMTARVREAIRDDGSTTAYADAIEISTDGRTVWLRGVVEDIDDDDNIVAVVSDLPGVADVVDELEVAGL